MGVRSDPGVSLAWGCSSVCIRANRRVYVRAAHLPSRLSRRRVVDFSLTDEQTLLRDSVRKLMDRVATPDYVRRLDREQAYPYELYDAWVKAGLLRLPYPEAYEGLGGSVIDMVIIAEELSRTSADFYMTFAGSTFCG